MITKALDKFAEGMIALIRGFDQCVEATWKLIVYGPHRSCKQQPNKGEQTDGT